MGKKLAILQSNYIPWMGYFDVINSVDEFVIYDDVQYTKNDWRNRNRIKTSHGVQWMTIPVKQTGLSQTIRETEVASDTWRTKHWKTIVQVYGRSAHFGEMQPLFESLYMGSGETRLSAINFAFISAINQFLGIRTKMSWSSNFSLVGDRNERLINLCKQAGADVYVTGPAALAYMDCDLFARAQISVEVASYSGYPEYPQSHPPFEHALSIIDLVFNAGREARVFMKSFPESKISEPFTMALPDWQCRQSQQ